MLSKTELVDALYVQSMHLDMACEEETHTSSLFGQDKVRTSKS